MARRRWATTAPLTCFNDTRPRWVVEAARDAWARPFAFFAGLPARRVVALGAAPPGRDRRQASIVFMSA